MIGLAEKTSVDLMQSEVGNTNKSAGSSITRLAHAIPIAEQNWPNDSPPVVSVACLAYNQEKFIAECLNGLLMQETTFPVEIIIHDDASTDRTPALIRDYKSRYPRLFRTILQTENQYSAGIPVFPILISLARGQYLARCDGDDYWSDATKLERQVKILEQNKDCIGVFHWVKTINEHNGKISEWRPEPKLTRYTVDDFLEYGNFICASSTLTRITSGIRFVDFATAKLSNCLKDYAFHVFNLMQGAYAFIDRPMAVYRVHSDQMFGSQPREDQIKQKIETRNILGSILGLRSRQSFKVGLISNYRELKKIYKYQRNFSGLLSCTISIKSYLTWNELGGYLLDDLNVYLLSIRSRLKLRTRVKQTFEKMKNLPPQ